jgi:hypothetical protein
VLIVIGGIFLVGQIVPGLAWWSLWPLIIVAAGVIQAVTPGHEGWNVNRLFDGLVTVTIGLVVLAVTTGVVGFGVVWEIIRLWPVLLIALGLDLLGKALHTSWVRAVGSLAVILALAYAVAVTAGSISSISLVRPSEGAEAQISEPVGMVDEADLTVDAGVADVTLTDGSQLVEASGVSPWGEPDFSVERSGETAEVSLTLGNADGAVVWPGGPDARLDAALSRDVLWDMTITTGVSSLSADLEDVPVRSIDLKPGVADCKVTLGDVPAELDESSALVRSGISSVSLRLPDGVEARIESDSGLTGHDIGPDFESRGGGVWQTPGFEDARDDGEGVWVITVKSGIGSISIDTY